MNGRIDAANGPTLPTTLCVFVSATNSSGDFSPARYIREPSRPQTVLCAPLLVSIVAITSPVVAVDDVPGVLLERRHVEHLAVGRDRHAVAALRQFLLPERLLGDQVDAVELLRRGEVEPARWRRRRRRP